MISVIHLLNQKLLAQMEMWVAALAPVMIKIKR